MDALFYPSLSLPGAAWTNPNLLFFDQIGVIAPDGVSDNLFDRPTRLLMRYGFVRAVSPSRYAGNDDDDQSVLDFLRGLALGHRGGSDLSRIHLGKLAHTQLPNELRRLRLLWSSHRDDWLEGPTWVTHFLMTVLAARMASDPALNVPLITNVASADQLLNGAARREQTRWSRRIKAISRLLPVGPDAELDAIARFREAHSRELAALRSYVEALVRRSPETADGENDFDDRLRRAEELRRHLVGELEAVRSVAPPLPILLTISTIAAAAAEQSIWSAGAAALSLGYLLHVRGQAWRRGRAARADKLAYAALAAKTFAPSRAEDTLR